MPSARLTTIGTGTLVPHPDRGPSSLLLSLEHHHTVIDLGSGALQKLAAVGVFPQAIHSLFLTHAHLDHCADVIPLLFLLSTLPATRETPLPIYASPSTIAYLQAAQRAFGRWLERANDVVRWCPLAPGERHAIGDLLVDVGTVAHTESSIAFRWTLPSGAVLVTPGDTGPHPPLEAWCADADTLVIECGSAEPDSRGKHMDPASLRAMLARTQPKRCVVVHLDEALHDFDLAEFLAETYSGEVIIPKDLDTFGI